MFAELTPAVARAVDRARALAAADGEPTVAPRHLLAGLTADDDGRAAQWLLEHGLDLRRWRESVGEISPDRSHDAETPLAAESTAALDTAASLARSSTADRIVTSEHLILGVLRTDAELRQRLNGFGLRIDDLEGAYHAAVAAPLALDAPLDLGDPVEQTDAARIVDANANRAREALRVLEDFARFSLNDALLSRQLKQLRHDLTDALECLPVPALLASRETLADVGTEISTSRELTRHSLRDVVNANVKRLQEALRSLEEYGKLAGERGCVSAPCLSEQLEKLRYQSYTLERALIRGSDARERLAGAKLYVLLTGSTCRAALDWTIAEAAAGGADVVQLREKDLPDGELLRRARDVRRWTRRAGVLFIVNDRPDIARLAEADGVHLGQDDMPVREARRILGPDALIGVSTHNLKQVRRAVLEGASYIGVGPTFVSSTKSFDELAGLDFVRAATAETSLPAFVLGGVTADNIPQVVAAGGTRVAVSAAVAQADDPRTAAQVLRSALP
jgi:thiamine-phosphate pyrophosphorylase